MPPELMKSWGWFTWFRSAAFWILKSGRETIFLDVKWPSHIGNGLRAKGHRVHCYSHLLTSQKFKPLNLNRKRVNLQAHDYCRWMFFFNKFWLNCIQLIMNWPHSETPNQVIYDYLVIQIFSSKLQILLDIRSLSTRKNTFFRLKYIWTIQS